MESYNKISGRKTLILVSIIIGLVLILTVYTVFLLFRKSGVMTKSTSFDKPMDFEKPTEAPLPTRQTEHLKIPERHGD